MGSLIHEIRMARWAAEFRSPRPLRLAVELNPPALWQMQRELEERTGMTGPAGESLPDGVVAIVCGMPARLSVDLMGRQPQFRLVKEVRRGE